MRWPIHLATCYPVRWAPPSGHSKRSKYAEISQIPEAGPGVRSVDPSDAINSKAPLHKLVGTIAPSDLHDNAFTKPAVAGRNNLKLESRCLAYSHRNDLIFGRSYGFPLPSDYRWLHFAAEK